jgi:NADH dehydrogenase
VILVAGGTGTLGSRVTQQLAKAGAPVRVLTRDATRAARLAAEGAEVAIGDVRDPATVRTAVRDVTTVVSAIQGFAGLDPNGAEAVDLSGNRTLHEEAAAAGAQRFVLISAAGAAADSTLDLRRVKHQAEQDLARSGLSWTVVRPTVYLETWLAILGDMAAKGAITLFGRGDNPINFVSADDVAALTVHVAESPAFDAETLEIGGPENLTLNDLARRVLARHGSPGRVRHVPLPVLRAISIVLRPIKPDAASLAGFGVVMDTMDMTLAVDTARAAVADLPVTTADDLLG